MLDRERILVKLDELDGYVRELGEIAPRDFAEFQRIEKKRACERLLQVAVECMIDVCNLFVSGLRLGLPGEEDDLFEKLERAGVITPQMKSMLKEMKGFRNILVHEYSRVDDEIVYHAATERLGDFAAFRKAIVKALGQADPGGQ